jgi:predicted transcriptional regulator
MKATIPCFIGRLDSKDRALLAQLRKKLRLSQTEIIRQALRDFAAKQQKKVA